MLLGRQDFKDRRDGARSGRFFCWFFFFLRSARKGLVGLDKVVPTVPSGRRDHAPTRAARWAGTWTVNSREYHKSSSSRGGQDRIGPS